MAGDHPVVCVDMGTTNTRVWLCDGQAVLQRAAGSFGVRDSARQQGTASLLEHLRNLLQSVLGKQHFGAPAPSAIFGAGMITSALGLEEVPHIPAPASADDLARNVCRTEHPALSHLPVLLVPGIRTGGAAADLASLDIMRGEETLCVGLFASGKFAPGGTLLNLGSHWKLIRTSAAGQITSSSTTLSGELIHAVQSHTILAESLGNEEKGSANLEWVRAGMSEQRRSGPGRALFAVRLLQQFGLAAAAEQRRAFLIGACIASDLDAWLKTEQIHEPVVITGYQGFTEAWRWALGDCGLHAEVCTSEETEAAFLRGLCAICRRAQSL